MESQKLFVFLFFLAILSEICYAVAPNNFVYDILKAVKVNSQILLKKL